MESIFFFISDDLLRSKVEVKPYKLWSRISWKRYALERKCQQKLDKEFSMGIRMVKIFLTSGDLWKSKVKVNPQNFWSQISQKTVRNRENVSIEVREEVLYRFPNNKTILDLRWPLKVESQRSKVKVKPLKRWSHISKTLYELESIQISRV